MKLKFTVPIQDVQICTNGLKNGLLLCNGHAHSSFGSKHPHGDTPCKSPCKYNLNRNNNLECEPIWFLTCFCLSINIEYSGSISHKYCEIQRMKRSSWYCFYPKADWLFSEGLGKVPVVQCFMDKVQIPSFKKSVIDLFM